MDQITLKNFRCFREEQTARMAPLTLLVGENSTGKTSFLAMVRALWDVAYGWRNPDFKEDPYDLGSFDEIVHRQGPRSAGVDTFDAGFNTKIGARRRTGINFALTFGESGTTPVPVRRRLSRGKTWIDESFASTESYVLQVGTNRGAWEMQAAVETRNPFIGGEDIMLPPYFLLLRERLTTGQSGQTNFSPMNGGPAFSPQDFKLLNTLARSQMQSSRWRPFSSAPVRSKPRRTYDPSRPTMDPEGDYVPMFLADVFSRDNQMWTDFKDRFEGFGRASGLFDEISIKRLGKRGSEPFQVQVRKSGGRRKGPWRNLIDVGYGVSQALPVITELLRPEAAPLFLLQQPEVHLHPTAQAALGSLFCQVASRERQLVIETHSDYLLDRVRIDIRDGVSALRPDDVSILFFERDGLEVKIHSLGVDEEGNVLGAPESYGRFFMEETTRSLWKERSLL